MFVIIIHSKKGEGGCKIVVRNVALAKVISFPQKVVFWILEYKITVYIGAHEEELKKNTPRNVVCKIGKLY